MSGGVRYVLSLVLVAAISVLAFYYARPISYAGIGLIVALLFIRWFNGYRRTHRVSTWADVLADGFFLLVISTVFVTLCSTFFRTLRREVPRDPLVTAIALDSGERILEVLSAPDLTDPAARRLRVDKVDEQGRTPLMWAAYVDFADRARTLETDGQRLALVELLAQAGADPNAPDLDGWTALTWASWSGMPQVAERLLAMGARVDPADRQGQTPLMVAAARGNAAVVKLLVARGAEKDVKSRDGRTARAFAEQGQREYPGLAAAYRETLSVL